MDSLKRSPNESSIPGLKSEYKLRDLRRLYTRLEDKGSNGDLANLPYLVEHKDSNRGYINQYYGKTDEVAKGNDHPVALGKRLEGECFGKSMAWLAKMDLEEGPVSAGEKWEKTARDSRSAVTPMQLKGGILQGKYRMNVLSSGRQHQAAIQDPMEPLGITSFRKTMGEAGYKVTSETIFLPIHDENSGGYKGIGNMLSHASRQKGAFVLLAGNVDQNTNEYLYGHVMAVSSSSKRTTFYDPNHGAFSVKSTRPEGIDFLCNAAERNYPLTGPSSRQDWSFNKFVLFEIDRQRERANIVANKDLPANREIAELQKPSALANNGNGHRRDSAINLEPIRSDGSHEQAHTSPAHQPPTKRPKRGPRTDFLDDSAANLEYRAAIVEQLGSAHNPGATSRAASTAGHSNQDGLASSNSPNALPRGLKKRERDEGMER